MRIAYATIYWSCILMIWRNYGIIPAGYYMIKVNDRNSRKRCEICSKFTIKTLTLSK